MKIKRLNTNTKIIDSPISNTVFLDSYTLLSHTNGKKYFIGGLNFSNDSVNSVFEFDLTSASISEIPIGSMLTARTSSSVHINTLNPDDIFIFGGYTKVDNTITYTNTVEIYNLVSNISTLAPGLTLPSDLGKANIGSINITENLILFVGGDIDLNTSSDKIYIFDTITKTWTLSTIQLPQPLSSSVIAPDFKNNNFLIAGGINNITQDISKAIYKFTPSNLIIN